MTLARHTNPRSAALAFTVLSLVALVNSPTHSANLTVIHDQSGLTVVNAKAAQKFESSRSGRDSEGADNFTVGGSGAVVIQQILLRGHYAPTGAAATTVLVRILADSGGPGAELCATAGTVIAATSGDLTVDLQARCVLNPGTYWLAVQADLSWYGGGQWYWDSSATEVGEHAMWRNQGGGFPTQCRDFGTLPDCFGSSEISYIFSISGSPVMIFEDGFESGGTSAWSATMP